jgi:hypothetical protein
MSERAPRSGPSISWEAWETPAAIVDEDGHEEKIPADDPSR